MSDYIHFNINSPKFSPMGYFNQADGSVTINLDEIREYIENQYYCNTENAIIELVKDVLIHEDLHKYIDEADEAHFVINEQDEWAFKVIRDWIEFGKVYNSKN